MADNEFLADYEDEPEQLTTAPAAAASTTATNGAAKDEGDKKNYAGIHSSGFRSVTVPKRTLHVFGSEADLRVFL